MINDIQNLIDQLSVEQGVTEDFLLDILSRAVEEAWKNDAGEGYKILLEMEYSTKYGNNLHCYRLVNVVDNVEHPQSEISLNEAKLINPKIKVGDEIKLPMDLSQISRSGAKIAERYIQEHIFQKKKQNEFEYFSDKVGTIVTGVVKARSNQGIIVELYGFEGIIMDYKPHQLNQVDFPIGSKIKAYVYKIEENPNGFQVFLSRNNEEFLVELMKEEVPEIKNGLVSIMGVARNPGFASILMVKSEDEFNKINEVGVCIGSGGQRIKNIQKELKGEKISIVPWKDLLFARVATLLSHKNKVNIKKIILHDEDSDEERYIEVIVPQDQVSKIIGVRGRNIDLLSRVLGEKLKITSNMEKEETQFLSYMSDEEKQNIVKEFMDKLSINEENALLLLNYGLLSLESVANMSFSDFLLIPLEGVSHGMIYNKALENSPKKVAEEPMENNREEQLFGNEVPEYEDEYDDYEEDEEEY